MPTIQPITLDQVDSLNDLARYFAFADDGKATYSELSKYLQMLHTYKDAHRKFPDNAIVHAKNFDRIRKGVGKHLKLDPDELRSLTNRIVKEEIERENKISDVYSDYISLISKK